ncbi:hypothetical protein GGI12_003724, partial [Dipsacomyces acuminosporus]
GKKVETWEAGRHEFPFSLAFPGNLPETISLPYANVSYQLKATLRRTGLMPNITAKRDVLVKRDLTMGGSLGTGAIDIENRWRDKLDFRITSAIDTFVPGDDLLARFTFQPLVKHMHLTKIAAMLKEYVRCHTPSGEAEKTVSRVAAFADVVPDDDVVGHHRLEDAAIYDSLHQYVPSFHSHANPESTQTACHANQPQHTSEASSLTAAASSSDHRAISTPPNTRHHHHSDRSSSSSHSRPQGHDPMKVGVDLTHAVEATLRLRIPDALKRLQYDHLSSYIEVTHKLKFSIQFKDPDNLPHTLWISVPVSIVPVIAGSPHANSSDLPTYENAALDKRVAVATADPGPPTYDTVVTESLSCAASQQPSTAAASRVGSPALESTGTPPVPSSASDTDSTGEYDEPSISVDAESLSQFPSGIQSYRRESHTHLSVDSSRPLVHPATLQNFLRRPVVFPASAEVTPAQTPRLSPILGGCFAVAS